MTSTQDRPPSSPAPGGSLEQDLAYYKSQYEQLESELQDFQASSRELESELEKDIEASEKRERQLKEKLEAMGFEVEEWKVSPLPMSRLSAIATLWPSRCLGSGARGRPRSRGPVSSTT